MRRATLILVGGIAWALVLTGCGPSLPPYEEVRAETHELMQEVVDVMPSDAEVDDIGAETPFGCDGAGYSYTGNWVVTTRDLDTEAFVNSLPEALGEAWQERTDALPAGVPSISLINGGWLVRVSAIDDDNGAPAIGIIAMSPCGEIDEQ